MNNRLLAGFGLLLTSCAALCADGPTSDAKPDKSGYWLLKPTPKSEMREMSTDRPDKTESPYTVDAGHFQIEMDLVSYTRDHSNQNGQEDKVESISFAPINLKVGLCNRVDLQLVLAPYTRERSVDVTAQAPSVVKRGFGDVTTRLKMNFWGNDGGKTAFAAMPYLKIPTSHDLLGNEAVEGGVILPLSFSLPAGFGSTVMTQYDFVRNDANDGYHTEYVNSITLSRDIVGNLGGYIELWTLVNTDAGQDWQATFDMGLTYGLTEDIQLDGGVNIGLTESADDLQPFIGMSMRF